MRKISRRKLLYVFFTKLSDYHYKGKTLNYLYTIAGNLCKDYLKRTKETLLEENEFEEENQTEQILNRVLIEQVLEQLPDESREVLTLLFSRAKINRNF